MQNNLALNGKGHALLTLMKAKKIMKNGRNKKITHVLEVIRNDEIMYCPLPSIDKINHGLYEYIPLERIVLDTDTGDAVSHKLISGLCLMPNAYNGIVGAMEKYNNISRDIGDFKVFGKITKLINLKTQNSWLLI